MEVILGRSTRFVTILGLNQMFMTKHFLETVRFVQCTDTRRWKFKLTEKYPRYENCNYVPFFNHIVSRELPFRHNNYNGILMARYCDSKQPHKEHCKQADAPKKLSLFAKMKQLAKDYWHILVPVHVITSLGWTAIFYLTIKNGVDIGKLMELMKFSDKYLSMIQNSDAGNWALTYALYKIFTPLRYTVTLGLTTMAIKHLSKSGYVKPLPFGKQVQVVPKATELNKPMATDKNFKAQRQTEPPKT